jgi:hypothetical protein
MNILLNSDDIIKLGYQFIVGQNRENKIPRKMRKMETRKERKDCSTKNIKLHAFAFFA